MCIYYKNKQGLTYKSGEHIFPAGLGGNAKLPLGFVSDQFNNEFSKLEQSFMRGSLVSLMRQMEGPGKRGSLVVNNATRSSVHVADNHHDPGMPSLGYIQLGKFYEIPHLLVGGPNTIFSFDARSGENSDAVYEEFCRQCLDPDTLRIRVIDSDKVPKDQVFFGVAKGVEENYNSFFAKHPDNQFVLNIGVIQEIVSKMTRTGEKATSINYQPVAELHACLQEDHFRVYGKIAFNCLAAIMGEEFVLQDTFDPYRAWIVKGGDYSPFAQLYHKDISPLEEAGVKLPASGHHIHISRVNDYLLASLFFYQKHGIVLTFSKKFTSDFADEGIICDWKNENEFALWDYINSTANPHESIS